MQDDHANLVARMPTYVDILRWRALNQPDQPAYTFLLDGEAQEVSLTYAELDLRARSIAAMLQSVTSAGARALLLYPPGLDYIAAFFGCLYAGNIAVPAYPPNPARLDRTLPRLRAIIGSARPEVMLTTTPILAIAEAMSAQMVEAQSARWLATDAIDAGAAAGWRADAIEATTLAFLQYTSGSTAAPKGVMLTHANLLHNSSLIAHAFGHTRESRGVIWLPPYHDMGLIGGILQPLYVGFPVTLMSPVDFLQRPLRWLQAITRYRATTSGGPNFAYDLCTRKVTPEQRALLDLSSWTVAFNGAEPIHPETIDRFTDAFAACGFRREAFYPCYGLAEATLIVSGGRHVAPPIARAFAGEGLERHRVVERAAADPDAYTLIGCGQALAGMTLAIVDPETQRACSPNQVGEVWVAGPSVAQGYWEQPDETERGFRARMAATDGCWMRTGDLGFVHGGELFVTGRLKDLIIIRGRNYYPQDIELAIERSHPALRPGCGAAFTVEVDAVERLVIVQEVDRQQRNLDVEAAAAAIRQAVSDQHEVRVYAVVLIKHGSLPKTSSGKIQRHACRKGFLDGTLEVVGRSVLGADVEERLEADEPLLRREDLLGQAPDEQQRRLEVYLLALAARVLQVDPARIDPQQPFSALGIDSLAAVELQQRIEADLYVGVPLSDLLQGRSIAQLASGVRDNLAAGQLAAAPLVPGQAAEGEHPLSYGQRALWFLHQLAPESAAYNIAHAALIRDGVDPVALRRALQTMVERHPALRTTFSTRDGEPVQIVHPRAEVALDLEDASEWSEEQLRQRLVEAAYRPFDLDRGPLLRMHLFTRGPRGHVLLLVVHHIVADLWSLTVLLHELGILYPGARSGAPPALPPIPLHYTDVVRWQAEQLAGEPGTRLWAWWQHRLSGDLPVLELPADRPRPAVQTYRGAAHAFRLGAAMAQRLRALAQAEQVTLSTLLLATFQVLLSRYTGQEDVLVGSPTAGRSRPELAPLVGYFVNPVVLRTDLSGNPTFREALRRVRDVVLGALEHQDFPFPLLVERVQPERDPGRSPLFQVMFVMQKAHLRDEANLAAYALGEAGVRMRLGGLELESIALDQRVAQFDLTLMMVEADDALLGSLQYNADLFDAATIARMGGHFQALLERAIETPDRRLGTLSFLTADERRALADWNSTAAPFPQEQCIHRLFEAQAARTPDAIAVVFDGPATTGQGSGVRGLGSAMALGRQAAASPIPGPWRLTYRELNARANQVAHYLQSLGVGPEAMVGICMRRSVDLVVGILGILKAGAAYVPLDPAYPHERLAFMLRDSRASVLLTSEGRGAWDEGLGARDQEPDAKPQTPSPQPLASSPTPMVICLDRDWPLLAQAPRENPICRTSAENLAYVIYTSGSTGTPKGVAIAHRSTVALLTWAARIYAPADLAGVLAATSICFDLSVFELFVPLCAGGTVIVAENALQLPKLPDASQVTLINTVPSAIAELVRADSIPESVRVVNLAGEALPQALVQRIYAQPTVADVVNLYGPTEDTTYSTVARIPRGADSAPPIGRPIDNTQVYLLDQHLQPVPIGVAGELYLGGAGLARGYLGRPDLTAERFIPNPFASAGDKVTRRQGDKVTGEQERYLNLQSPISNLQSPDESETQNSRLYRTGDLARYLPDGSIQYLGRIDHQIKLRGFRIELGEIESVLTQQPAVREAVVVVREDAPGDKRLVAYVVPATDKETRRQGDKESGRHGDTETRRQGDKETGDAGDSQSSVLSPQHSASPSSFILHPSSLGVELRGFLKERLPEYLVPAAFVLLEALPLTPNGKLDRRALPAPSYERARPAGVLAPRTPTEELLAAIWREVLGLEQVGVDEDFFSLGGHSLLATRVIVRARAVFGVELPLLSLFEAPTIAGLAGRVALASGAAVADRPPLRRAGRSTAPLSFAQQRLWFLDMLEPESAVYNIPAAVRLEGELDVAALARALDALTRRHEALRTTFPVVDGQPVQRVAAAQPVPLPAIDLSDLAGAEQEERLREVISTTARRPFDLARGPLLRADLIRLAARDHVLVLTLHHIVADGWSLGVLVRDLGALYAAQIDGTTAPLPALEMQYADYALWQRDWLQGAALERELAYWRRQLADIAPSLDLPADHPRPTAQTFSGARLPLMLPQAVTDSLKALSRREGVTLFMALLAAFQALLARYSGQTDIPVGVPIAGRTWAETESLIGCFVNTLVLRTDLSGAPSYRELLKRVRATTLGAYAHQDMPFERLVEELQPVRDLSRSPLFQVMFVLQNAPLPALALPGLAARVLDAGSATAKFDLTLELAETPEGLHGWLEYNTDLFESATIARMAGHLRALLEGIVATPDLPLARVALLGPQEQHQMLVAWNARHAPLPPPDCIHDLFEQQAARTPGAVALVFDRPTTNDQRPTTGDTETGRHGDTETRGDGGSPLLSPQSSALSPSSLTYHELNRRANQLAHELRSLGVGPEVPVGICLERTPDLVVSMLAVLKAGGAYVPLDPAYPPARLAFMLADSGAAVLLTSKGLGIRDLGLGIREQEPVPTAHVPSPTPIVVCLDAIAPAVAAAPDTNPPAAATPDNLAYLIYTSGSTGQPKGVAITHRSAAARLAWGRRQFRPDQLAGVLAATSICFDLSIFELFVPLCCGGSVILAENALQLPILPGAGHVTLINTVPSAMAELIRMGGVPESVRSINLAGEALPRQLAEMIYALPRVEQLYNLYGPSEDTTYSTMALIDRDSRAQPPIGQPLPGTQVYVLDEALQPTPIGVPGELYIGGEGLARGYHGRPDLTAERFVPNPFAKDEGSRMKDESPDFILHPSSFILYRTGDLVRYLPDGTLQYLGRLDHQIKLRGYRIELGEIETALRAHPAVRECVVLARAGGLGGRRLVAYATPREERHLTVGEMRRFLGATLPDYMIPAALVTLDRLPLTANGKLDRRALPEPDAERPSLEASFVAPRTPTEEQLAQILSQLLGVAQVGVYDNFFELGGHSLLATQLVLQVRDRLQVDLPLRSVFEALNVAALTEQIETMRWAAHGRPDLADGAGARDEGRL